MLRTIIFEEERETWKQHATSFHRIVYNAINIWRDLTMKLKKKKRKKRRKTKKEERKRRRRKKRNITRRSDDSFQKEAYVTFFSWFLIFRSERKSFRGGEERRQRDHGVQREREREGENGSRTIGWGKRFETRAATGEGPRYFGRKERKAYFERTHRDTSSWETARGVAAPWRAREDAWRDSCEYGSVELFSSADTEPFCFPVHERNEWKREKGIGNFEGRFSRLI